MYHAFWFQTKFLHNTSLAASGALAHRLQHRTACNAEPPASGPQNGQRGLESNDVYSGPNADKLERRRLVLIYQIAPMGASIMAVRATNWKSTITIY